MKTFNAILLLAILLLAHSHPASAGEKYEFCEIYGIAGGAEDKFIQTLALRIISQRGLDSDQTCSVLMQDSYKFGKQFSSGALFSESSILRWNKYQKFRDHIADKMIEMSGY